MQKSQTKQKKGAEIKEPGGFVHFLFPVSHRRRQPFNVALLIYLQILKTTNRLHPNEQKHGHLHAAWLAHAQVQKKVYFTYLKYI